MSHPAQLLIVGDHDPDQATHRAIDDALGHVRSLREHSITWHWVHTTDLATDEDCLVHLGVADAIWLAPGSPYACMDGALRAVRLARTRPLPFLGVCGGFQHAVLAIARDLAGLADAEHAESNPAAATPVIRPLACSLIGQSRPVFLDPTSRTATIYGRWRVVEAYHCAYGVNPDFRLAIERAGLRFVGEDDRGDPRVAELIGHPFFIATLFQPQLASTPDAPAPLVRAIVDAAILHREGRLGRTATDRRADSLH